MASIKFEPELAGRWAILDWGGMWMCEGDFAETTWDTFEDARAAIDVHTNNLLAAGEITEAEWENEPGEYYAYQIGVDGELITDGSNFD